MSRLISAVVMVLLLAPGRTAQASAPASVYVVPYQVDFLPNQNNATSVVIHGAFTFWINGFNNYTMPKCGYMYFNCAPGSEAMCRMQWGDLAKAIGQAYCAGFGQLSMVTMGTLRADGAPLANPDTWDLGMGIVQSFGGGNIPTCNATMALKCSNAPADMTMSPPDLTMVVAPDLTMPPARDLSTRDLSTPPPDLTMPPADLSTAPAPDQNMPRDLTMSPVADLAVPLDMSANVKPDMATSPDAAQPQAGGMQCSAARHSGAPAPEWLVGLAVFLAIGCRRRTQHLPL